MTIAKVAVIGSGVMGSGIAAQIANAGVPVVLLDIVPKDAGDRSMLARGAIQKLLKADPAPLMALVNAKLIVPGNMEDDLELLRDCDWIVEVVLEDLKVKHATYEKDPGAPQAGLHRLLQHLLHSAAQLLVEPFGDGARAKDFPHHSLLQPAALHASAGSW